MACEMCNYVTDTIDSRDWLVAIEYNYCIYAALKMSFGCQHITISVILITHPCCAENDIGCDCQGCHCNAFTNTTNTTTTTTTSTTITPTSTTTSNVITTTAERKTHPIPTTTTTTTTTATTTTEYISPARRAGYPGWLAMAWVSVVSKQASCLVRTNL